MYEVEVKVRADHDRVRERLREAEADRVGAVTQADTYYDAPHRDFAETDEAVRVRRTDREGSSDTRLTYKGPKIDDASKTREEIGTEILNPDAAGAILEALGFAPVATVRKERECFELRGYTVTLDDVDGLGAFVEVERTAPETDIETVREGALGLLGDLGLDPDASITRSYLGLLLDAQE